MKNKDKRFKIIFMGTPEFAVPALDSLIKGPDEIVAVVTQPDKPKGRGRKLLPSPIKKLAQKHEITLFQPVRVSEKEFIEKIRSLEPDLFVVCAFGQILPQKLLDIPKIMPINIHGSLLPKYRGAAPIQWAILNGETETGITIMKMDAGMDTGPMLLKRSLKISNDMTFGQLSDEMAQLGASALMEALDLLENGKLKEIPQPDDGISYAPPIKKEQLHINWKEPARVVQCQIRAFDPKPGAYTIFDGERIRLFNPHIEERDGQAGEVLEVSPKGILIGCGTGSICIKEIQWPGRKRLKVEDFLRGKSIQVGSHFS